jgi:hypothetical protein
MVLHLQASTISGKKHKRRGAAPPRHDHVIEKLQARGRAPQQSFHDEFTAIHIMDLVCASKKVMKQVKTAICTGSTGTATPRYSHPMKQSQAMQLLSMELSPPMLRP